MDTKTTQDPAQTLPVATDDCSHDTLAREVAYREAGESWCYPQEKVPAGCRRPPALRLAVAAEGPEAPFAATHRGQQPLRLIHVVVCTLHPTPYTLHPTPYTLYPTPYTLHQPYTQKP